MPPVCRYRCCKTAFYTQMENENKMKYSVCIDALFMGRCSFADGMRKVKEAGYQAIEFWSWWDKDIEEIRNMQKELDLEVAAFCTELIHPGDLSLQQDYLDGLKRSVETAKKLDCGVLIAQAGWEYDSFPKGITKKQHRDNWLHTMEKAALIAEREDITLVIEPLNVLVDHPGYHLSASRDAFGVIDNIGSSRVKVLFDIYHQQITEGNLLMNITENLDKIGHFHAAGNPGRMEITKGEINYRYLLEALERMNYEGCVGLEYMPEDDPVKGLTEAKKTVIV